MNQTTDNDYLRLTRKWVSEFVVGLNLCPFAGRELANNRVRFSYSAARESEQLLEHLLLELRTLEQQSEIETSVLVHPHVLTQFADYNQFLELCDALLINLQLEDQFQVASFHPDYIFADTEADDVANFTNRSPYPMLHILRESSVSRAVDSHPDVGSIPTTNIRTLRDLGHQEIAKKLSAIRDRAVDSEER